MNRFALATKATPALSVLLLAALTACGGGSGTAATPDTSSATATDSADAASTASGAAAIDAGTVAQVAATEVTPSYHMAPVLLDEPASSDVGGTNASARFAPKSWQADADLADLPTARLTRDVLTRRIAELGRMRAAAASAETVSPKATTITGTVFTPAQIRAAYGLVALPSVGASLSASQAAALGAGQTIYVIDAYHDATALSDLNAFSAKFGLPSCTNVTVATAAVLPAAPSTCTFAQVHSTLTSAITATVPAYNGTWAPESKLDVQWAHAIAPLARIVLIEMPDSMSNSILGATQLAKVLGPGAVSMSFGSTEAAWASSYDAYFAGTGMTYVASAGDSGSQVLWPAVSPSVLAVGGTGMNWSGSTRTEVAWSGTGGGISASMPLPAYQSGIKTPSGVALARRAVPDVAFNASPSTGQYVAITLPGQATAWSAYGGTSIAAPQWAGIVAVANAIRAANAKAALGDFHTQLYKSIATVPGTYASSMGDITEGSNGTCATCAAGVGYDLTTGLGTPNSAGLLAQLTGVGSAGTAATTAAPTVPGGSYTGKAGTAVSQSLGVTVPTGTTTSYALSGAPSGLTVDSTGTLKWAAPVAGSYSFVAVATTAAGKSAQGSYALKVIPGVSPAFTSNGIYTATAGAAFSGTLQATNPNTGSLSYSISGAPSGMTVTGGGTLGWGAATAGTYSFTAKVTDNYGYSSTQTVKLTVAAATSSAPTSSGNHAPTLAAATFSIKAGSTWYTTLVGKDADGDAMSYSVTGGPTGVYITANGMIYWVGAIKGTYHVTVNVRDTKGAIGTAVLTLIVA